MGAYKVRRRRSMVFEGDGGGGGGGSPLWRQGRPVKNPRFPSARFARRLAQNKKTNKGASIPFLTLFRF